MAVSDQLTESQLRGSLARAGDTRLTSVPHPHSLTRVHLSSGLRECRPFVSLLEAVVGADAVNVPLHQAQVCFVELCHGTDLPRVPIVAVTDLADLDSHRAAVAMGAAALLDLRCTASQVEGALAAALAGCCQIPRTVAPTIVTRLDDPPGDLYLSDAELLMLQGVADGRTVDELAAMFNCSSRHVRRRLRDLWSAMGATGRATGLVKAARWGLVS